MFSVKFNAKSALLALSVLNTSLIVPPVLNVTNPHLTCPCVKLDLSAPPVTLAPKSCQRFLFAQTVP